MAEDIARPTADDESEHSLEHYLNDWVERLAREKKTAMFAVAGARALDHYGAEGRFKPSFPNIETANYIPKKPHTNVEDPPDRWLWAPFNAKAKAASLTTRFVG